MLIVVGVIILVAASYYLYKRKSKYSDSGYPSTYIICPSGTYSFPLHHFYDPVCIIGNCTPGKNESDYKVHKCPSGMHLEPNKKRVGCIVPKCIWDK